MLAVSITTRRKLQRQSDAADEVGESRIAAKGIERLAQLDNTKEKGVVAYTRLTSLLLKVSGFQPSAPRAMVEMLAQSIETAEAIVDAGEATVKEATID